MNGIIPVNKPTGCTSHDVVARVRRILKTRRVGHTGTLDPLAEGVLPICIGNATKAVDMLTESDKMYEAELILGATTDTLDATGNVTSKCEPHCTEDEIKNVIFSFVGEQEQIPPMYSAIKQNGKKLYELAREGIEVKREPRKITIYEINILKIDLKKQSVTIDVHCSKGTYIRSLCDDIGSALGVGAYMNTLKRTKSAGFKICECVTLEKLEELSKNGKIEDVVINVDKFFENYPAVTLIEKQASRITNGVFVSCNGIEEGELYRVYDPKGAFLCLARCQEQRLRVVKSFWC